MNTGITKEVWRRFWQPVLPLFVVLPLFTVFFLLVWQGIQKASLLRKFHSIVEERDTLQRKNDELKIGIVSYTSAERIETLYRRTYQYLPVSFGNRTITVELPPEPNKQKELGKR